MKPRADQIPDLRGACAQIGKHVWTYTGKKWPYAGQPCCCGETTWHAAGGTEGDAE